MICPFNIYPNGQFSVYMSKDPGENQLRMCLDTCEKADVEKKYRNVTQKQKSVKSICSITRLAQVFCTLPGWLCVPAKSIHLSLLQRAKPAHRDRRQEHTRREVMPRGKKWKRLVKIRQIMQRGERNHTFSVFSTAPFQHSHVVEMVRLSPWL